MPNEISELHPTEIAAVAGGCLDLQLVAMPLLPVLLRWPGVIAKPEPDPWLPAGLARHG